MTEADSRIEIIPPSWWSIVLVGMALPKDHPSIQVKPRMPKGETYEGPIGAFRTPRVGAKGMKAAAFDNAIRAGRREVIEARVPMTPGKNLHTWEHHCDIARAEREWELVRWMASFGETPYLVQPQGWDWSKYRLLLIDCRLLDVEPECWEFDDTHLDKVPAPRTATKSHSFTGRAA